MLMLLHLIVLVVRVLVEVPLVAMKVHILSHISATISVEPKNKQHEILHSIGPIPLKLTSDRMAVIDSGIVA